MNSNTFRTLEFEAIRALVLSHVGSAAGRSRIEALTPHTEPGAVRAALSRTTEGTAVLRTLGRQPYHDLPDISPALVEARVEGHFLEPLALADVASFAEGAIEIGRRVSRAEAAPELARLASGIADASETAAAIRRAILPGGEVADDASPRLGEVRRTLVRLKAQLQSVMESYLRGKDADRLLQDKLVTTRNDRYVLLLKAEHRGSIPGIIHGSSGSGASFFVEPLPAVEVNNDIVSWGDEERAEVVRILRALTGRVRDRADHLGRAVEILGELDALQAMALTARDMDALAPEVVPAAAGLRLVDARHPLLMTSVVERVGIARRSTREPVPVSIAVDGGSTVLVISGPNTGGKTVALKTVGLLALMAQSGLHVPAAPGTSLPVFRRIYADIGDEQSIAANLSTFSAHLANIVAMTRDLATPALVLLDEVGAGTDPTEGGALGVAIVDMFKERGAMAIATTHHGLMKAYAQSTPGVTPASFGYDPATYEPTYRLEIGTAGRSLALEMAERLGLPLETVQDARRRLDLKEAQAEALLKKLEEDQALLRAAEEDLARRRVEVESAEARVGLAEREIAARKKTEVEAFARELRRRGEDAVRKAAQSIEDTIRRLEQERRSSAAAVAKARSTVARLVREATDEVLAGPGVGLVQPEPERAEAPIALGARVKVRSLGVTGEVMGLHGGEAELAISGKRMRVPRGELVALGEPPPSRRGGAVQVSRSPAASSDASGGGGSAEVNLVGLTVDEALPRVDKALDQAALAEKTELRVIHGFGQGTLRRAVAEFLEDHPHVAHVRVGAEGRGGVTVVELKE
ncbi:MAG TPA: Smr/MutS family protein [Vicinamibacteria bacterium]|nr:Smr/MutS family protein [Vicinamibacteria bacterium]